MPEFESCSLSHPLSRVFVELRKPNHNETPGVSWFVGDSLLFKTWDKENFSSLDFSARRTTVVSKGGVSLSTPEHLSPLLIMWHHLCIDVHVPLNTGELPLLDGSSRPWLEGLLPKNPFSKELLFYDINESFRIDFQYGFCQVEPSLTFEVEYSLEQEGFSDSEFVAVYAPEDLLKLLNARTFIFENHYKQAKEQGLLSHVSESSGLLLAPQGGANVKVLQGEKLRFPQEIIYHKVLDLVGDLTLLVQELPRARFRIHNGGHSLHHQIFKRLVKYVHSRYPS